MIAILNGTHETVVPKSGFDFLLHDNTEFTSYPEHWHAELEIVMPLEGHYFVRSNDQEYLLNVGDILVINSGVLHYLEAPEEGHRLFLQPSFTLLHDIHGLESLLSMMPPALLITPDTDPEIHARLHEIILLIKNEYQGSQLFAEASIYSLLIEFFVLIGRKHSGHIDDLAISSSKKKEYAEKFSSICTYVNDHLSEDMDLDTVAAMVGFSKYHFTRQFKQYTGYSFYKYLNRKRIENAEKLLVDPNISITEAAIRSGFSSPSAFIRMFKQMKGCTPSEFRSLYQW